MNKELSEMTLEELLELFPIILKEHNDAWKEWYEEESSLLRKALVNQKVVRMSHIGSTTINGIWAKPTVDILVEVEKAENLQAVKEQLQRSGYVCMSDNGTRLCLNKGYTKDGFAKKVFHIHIRYAGDNDELYFRDYMNEYPELAKEYEVLKLSLWKQYEHDRDGYTEAKTEFVKRYTELAKERYGLRY